MRCLTVILLVFLVNFVCLGNKVSKNLVSKVESLNKELQESKDSISSLTKELTVLKTDLEKVKTRSEAFDESVWEYGSSLVGIMVGLIILFGIVYYNSSKQAARDAFDDGFENYAAQINKKVKQANSLLDILESRVGFIEEGDQKLDNSLKNIDSGYGSRS
jgi:peptidoglycan hydrolase CwlO-like protein